MLKKTITFIDYYGEERTQDFYFNLTKSELTIMNLSEDGGVERLIERITQTHDNKKLVEYFQDLILRSYGEKSQDGLRFVKSPELSEAFRQTPAYDILFMELATDAKAASDFVNGIVPADIAKKMAEEELGNQKGLNPAVVALQGKNIPPAIPQAHE